VLRYQGTKLISEALSEQRSTWLVTDGVPEPGIGGCNEPGPFRKGYLDKGASGSLLMTFPATGNKWV